MHYSTSNIPWAWFMALPMLQPAKNQRKRRTRQLFWHTPQFSRRLPLANPGSSGVDTFCGHALLPSPRVFPARTRCYVLCLRNMKSNRTPLFGTAFFNKAEVDGLGIATRKTQNKQITSQHRVGIPLHTLPRELDSLP